MITFANIPKNNGATVAFGVKEIGPYYWLGNCKNGIDYYAGQTFTAPVTGTLKRIQLYASVVYGTSDATLSIYHFNATANTFGLKLTETSRQLSKANENQWIEFLLPEIEVNQDEQYAFKISCTGTGMLAIAECPWNTPNPYPEGVQWTGSSIINQGSFHSDFDFAFEGEIAALPDAKFI
jgi:hypothetical protein